MPNLFDVHWAPRCGAKTRKGGRCRQPAVRNGRRCRMHRGAGDFGRANPAFRFGRYTKKAKEELAEAKRLEAEARIDARNGDRFTAKWKIDDGLARSL